MSAITSNGPPYDRSSFNGLGVGVRVLTFLENKYFEVSQSDFSDCYNGIIVDGVSVGTMLFNHFDMGNMPDPDVINWELYEGGQVGIIVRKGISGFVLEENEFEAEVGNAHHTIGIVCENIGTSNNLVRNNFFDGLTNPNQSVELNGGLGDSGDGLFYLCNENEETTNLDFYIPSNVVSPYVDNKIATQQYDLRPGAGLFATGNEFAKSGSSADRDFGNYGGFDLWYFYYTSDADQVPEDYFGLNDIYTAAPNTCASEYCIPPCLSELEDDKEIYFETVPLYYDELRAENWDTAAAYKMIMDRASLRVLQFYLQDTLTFNNDSLLLWYHYLLTPVGEILRSKYFAAKGDFTTAGQLLAAIPNFYDLTDQEENDLDDLQDIYDILEARSIENLTSGDFDDLEQNRHSRWSRSWSVTRYTQLS